MKHTFSIGAILGTGHNKTTAKEHALAVAARVADAVAEGAWATRTPSFPEGTFAPGHEWVAIGVCPAVDGTWSSFRINAGGLLTLDDRMAAEADGYNLGGHPCPHNAEDA